MLILFSVIGILVYGAVVGFLLHKTGLPSTQASIRPQHPHTRENARRRRQLARGIIHLN